ncbi:hypothetical protein [Methylomagnum sp.]
MSGLDQFVRIKSTFTRSINLARDAGNLDVLRAYVPTSRAVQALTQIADGLNGAACGRALALIGPYGSGKSAFALFLGALLSPEPDEARRIAADLLRAEEPALARRFAEALDGRRGCLWVQVNGIPDSLVRQLLTALALAVEQAGLSAALASNCRAAAKAGTPQDQVLALFRRAQSEWADAGGGGVLVEIDELGKFLEYESYHPQHREIHLLQLLAEHAQTAHRAPLHLLVMLHQAFEHYSHRLGKQLRDEWQKVQGRFNTLAFLESPEQSLALVGAAFEPPDGRLSDVVIDALEDWTPLLAAQGALPAGFDEAQARRLFRRCYPLHPLTLLILPVLCQKAAQNERTLFSYLGSGEPFGLRERLGKMGLGEWVEPWQLYDYFMSNPAGSFSDPLTQHRWSEVATALERFDGDHASPAARLLKTIGLFNLIGAQRGLKASRGLLRGLFGEATDGLLARLQAASVIHLRQFSQEYQVWQGSDFDLAGAVRQASAEYMAIPLADLLNELAPLKAIVARRVTIATGSLRSFTPTFTSRLRWPSKTDGELTLWFYLAEPYEDIQPDSFPLLAVVAVCEASERLQEATAEWKALLELPKRHAALHDDPVAQREYRAWLENAEAEALRLIRALLDEPEADSLRWFRGGKEALISGRGGLQQRLSEWVEKTVYSETPLFRNELINRDQPSPSANTGRKRLLAAMLAAPDRENLGIAKTPAEKSLYLSLLKESRLHRKQDGRRGFYPPDPAHDPCRVGPVWAAITQILGDSGERQVPLPELYATLAGRPYGVKRGVLPVLIVAYLLAHRREVAVYQEGAFCEALTIEQAELLCRRPELFALERFGLEGLWGDLFEHYAGSVVGGVAADASLLELVRPLVRFMGGLPEYTQHCPGLSREAKRVREAFQQAKSPGVLLFDALPKACGVDPAGFAARDSAVVKGFIELLAGTLRELKQAYPNLLDHWREELNGSLLDTPAADLAGLRRALAERYGGLERYTPDRMGVGALAKRLADTAHTEDQAWLESVATLIGRVPPGKWRVDTRLQAELRLREMAAQLRELESLRLQVADRGPEGAVLVKVVDAERGEHSRVVQLSAAQRARATDRAAGIARQFEGLDEAERLAVVAELFKRCNPSIGEPPNE